MALAWAFVNTKELVWDEDWPDDDLVESHFRKILIPERLFTSCKLHAYGERHWYAHKLCSNIFSLVQYLLPLWFSVRRDANLWWSHQLVSKSVCESFLSGILLFSLGEDIFGLSWCELLTSETTLVPSNLV